MSLNEARAIAQRMIASGLAKVKRGTTGKHWRKGKGKTYRTPEQHRRYNRLWIARKRAKSPERV